MRKILVGLAALLTASASQAAVQINFNGPAGLRGTSQSYSTGSYSVTAYGYVNFNFTTGTGTAGNLFDKNAGGDENGVGLQRDPTGNDEIWYAGDNFATIPAVILDVSSLIGSTTGGQFLMGSTTNHEQWIIRAFNAGTSTWTSPVLNGMSEGSFVNLPSWGTYSRYAFYSGGTVTEAGRQPGNVLLSALSFTPLPEPGTWALMLLGFGAIGFSVRRRKQGAAPNIA